MVTGHLLRSNTQEGLENCCSSVVCTISCLQGVFFMMAVLQTLNLRKNSGQKSLWKQPLGRNATEQYSWYYPYLM